MFQLTDVLQLKEHEQVRAIVRRHVVTLLPALCLAFVLIVIPFFLLFPLFELGIPGVIAFAVCVVGGIGIAIRALWLWDADVLIITTYRVLDVDQQGIFTRTVSEAPLATVQDVTWTKTGLLEALFGMGSLRIQTASTAPVIEALRVPFPHRLAELLHASRPGAASPISRAPDPPSFSQPVRDQDPAIQRIVQLLQGCTPEELVRIEAVLVARKRPPTDQRESEDETVTA